MITLATRSDLRALQHLMVLSFAEFAEQLPAPHPFCAELLKVWKETRRFTVCDDLLDETAFDEIWSKPHNKMWIMRAKPGGEAENNNNNTKRPRREDDTGARVASNFGLEIPPDVVGCVGCKTSPLNPYFEMELIHLCVNPPYRNRGYARVLVEEVIAFARRELFNRVSLWCGTSSSQEFYAKCGFLCARAVPTLPEAKLEPPPVSKFFVKYVQPRRLRNVALIGGTHGNELLGPHLVRRVWGSNNNDERDVVGSEGEEKRHNYEGETSVHRPSFRLKRVLANSPALKRCVRYVDKDLNRCFALKDLDEGGGGGAIETQLAHRLDEGVLGPKRAHHTQRACDYIIDLHSSTANMGVCIIVIGYDMLTIRMFARMREWWEEHFAGNGVPLRLMIETQYARDVNNNIDSVTGGGICVEVGPLPHGTLGDLRLLHLTKAVAEFALDFIHAHNTQPEIQPELDGGDAMMMGENPATRGRPTLLSVSNAEKKKSSTFGQSLTYYECFDVVKFPNFGADGTSPVGVHPDLVGKDFVARVEKGTPLFVDLATGEVVARYEGAEPVVYPCFINEAAYFSSGVAFVLTREKRVDVY